MRRRRLNSKLPDRFWKIHDLWWDRLYRRVWGKLVDGFFDSLWQQLFNSTFDRHELRLDEELIIPVERRVHDKIFNH
jgi:hypothetical protein